MSYIINSVKFLDRSVEILRIKKALAAKQARLIVIYGRRRCGKSTLIRRVLRASDIYFVAQQSDSALQRRQLAAVIGEKIPGFDGVQYPDWESLFKNLDNTLRSRIALCLDEFPYLAKNDPSLPSLLQKLIDNMPRRRFHLILCGSSQQMMQGMALDSTSPLYGRADEIIKIRPLEPGWLVPGLNCSAANAVEEYAVWGGVPRYWELRKEEASLADAIRNLILDRQGVLHEEPMRLFLDDMRESVQAYSIITLVGSGSNRLSEIAGKLNKPATHFSRPMENLVQLGYIKRDIPFGEREKNSKKGIYRIGEPFMNFYFSFVAPNISRLELGLIPQVYSAIEQRFALYVSREWERLCRDSIPKAPVAGISFDMASRWWGTGADKKPIEVDLIAESPDEKYLLIGECKWSRVVNTERALDELRKKAAVLPFVRNREIVPVLFAREAPASARDPQIFTPAEVLQRLK